MEKNCGNCKYASLEDGVFPCVECRNFSYEGKSLRLLWEPKCDKAVEHPAHYNHGKYECIDVMAENFGKEATQHFCLLNAFKYIWRSDYKNGTQDIKKAVWYLDKYLELEGE